MSDLMNARQLNALFQEWVKELEPDLDSPFTVENAWGMFETGYLEITYDDSGRMNFDGCGDTRGERRFVRRMNKPVVDAWKNRKPPRAPE